MRAVPFKGQLLELFLNVTMENVLCCRLAELDATSFNSKAHVIATTTNRRHTQAVTSQRLIYKAAIHVCVTLEKRNIYVVVVVVAVVNAVLARVKILFTFEILFKGSYPILYFISIPSGVGRTHLDLFANFSMQILHAFTAHR